MQFRLLWSAVMWRLPHPDATATISFDCTYNCWTGPYGKWPPEFVEAPFWTIEKRYAPICRHCLTTVPGHDCGTEIVNADTNWQMYCRMRSVQYINGCGQRIDAECTGWNWMELIVWTDFKWWNCQDVLVVEEEQSAIRLILVGWWRRVGTRLHSPRHGRHVMKVYSLIRKTCDQVQAQFNHGDWVA